MSEFSFGQMLESAKEAGGAGDWPPKGTYDVVITAATTKRSSSGKLSISLRGRVEGGPHDGAGTWSNQYLSPESPAALDIWFRTFESLGVPRNTWSAFGNDLDRAGASVCEMVKGAKCKQTVDFEQYQGQPQPRVKSISRRTGAPQVGPGLPGAAPVVAPPAPVAVPVLVPMPAQEPVHAVSVARPTF